MIWFMILVPATAIIAGGYIVLVQSRLTDGIVRTFGKYLAIWIFALGGLYFVGATTAAMYRGVASGMMMHGPGYMHGMMGPGAMGGRSMMGEGGMMQRGRMMDGQGMMGGQGMMDRNQAPAPASPESPPAPPAAAKP